MANGNGVKAKVMGASLFNDKSAAISKTANATAKAIVAASKLDGIKKDPVAYAVVLLARAIAVQNAIGLVAIDDGSSVAYNLSKVIGPAVASLGSGVDASTEDEPTEETASGDDTPGF